MKIKTFLCIEYRNLQHDPYIEISVSVLVPQLISWPLDDGDTLVPIRRWEVE